MGSEASTLDALLKFADTYGTIITGIPVLVAVVVAKQQMDASRRQHVATIKRSFQKELSGLDRLRDFTKQVLTATQTNSIQAFTQRGLGSVPIVAPTLDEIRNWRNILPPSLCDAAELAWKTANTAIHFLDGGERQQGEQATILAASVYASRLMTEIIREERRLSRYWS